MTDKKIPAGASRKRRKGKRDYANIVPIADAMEALGLLYTPSVERNDALTKHLMPYAVLGPSPRGVAPEKNRYLPFIEWNWYGGVCDLEWRGAKDHTITSEVADKLLREGWVEKTSAMHVYQISLLGIAIYAAHRQKMLQDAIGRGSASDPE